MFVPCRPGPGRLVLVAAGAGGQLLAELGRRRSRAAASRARAGTRERRDVLPADLVVVERGLDERDDARLVGDVGGEEDLHLARRSAGSPRRRRRPSRRARCGSAGRCSPARRGATRAPSAATRWAPRISSGTSSASAWSSCWSAWTWKLEIAVCRSCGDSLPPSPSSRKNSVPTWLLGLAGDRGDLAVVVLERVLLGRALAAAGPRRRAAAGSPRSATPATALADASVWVSAATSPPAARRGRGDRVRGSSSSSKKDTVGSQV